MSWMRPAGPCPRRGTRDDVPHPGHRQHDAVQPRRQRRRRHAGPGLPRRARIHQPPDEQPVDAAAECHVTAMTQ